MKASDPPFDTWQVAGIFQEHPLAPQMAIIPAGTYTMGSPPSETSAFGLDNDFDGKETQRQVTIAEPLAVGRFAVTRREFRAFVEATRFPIPDHAYTIEDDGFRQRDGELACLRTHYHYSKISIWMRDRCSSRPPCSEKRGGRRA
jgi:hypothetical protein